jgi:hypothetical protein
MMSSSSSSKQFSSAAFAELLNVPRPLPHVNNYSVVRTGRETVQPFREACCFQAASHVLPNGIFCGANKTFQLNKLFIGENDSNMENLSPRNCPEESLAPMWGPSSGAIKPGG